MLDMIRVLQWIQENIVYFRGDPSRVTIDGHSAGGCSVGLLMMSPLAKGRHYDYMPTCMQYTANFSRL